MTIVNEFLVEPVNTEADNPDTKTRMRRFTQKVAAVLNALLRAGVIDQVGAGTFGIAGILFVGHGAPASTLGYKGAFYFDLDAGKLYQNQ